MGRGLGASSGPGFLEQYDKSGGKNARELRTPLQVRATTALWLHISYFREAWYVAQHSRSVEQALSRNSFVLMWYGTAVYCDKPMPN